MTEKKITTKMILRGLRIRGIPATPPPRVPVEVVGRPDMLGDGVKTGALGEC
jgi:hypothetical protein